MTGMILMNHGAALQLFEDDGSTTTLRVVCSDWHWTVTELIRQATARGFRWLVAYWPHCPRGLVRLKSEAGLRLWERRRWRWFDGEPPIIRDVTDAIAPLCLDLAVTGPLSRGVRFTPTRGGMFVTTDQQKLPYDLTTTLTGQILPLPRTLWPVCLKQDCGEFFPPGVAEDRASWVAEMPPVGLLQ